jgi:hypothetical protein
LRDVLVKLERGWKWGMIVGPGMERCGMECGVVWCGVPWCTDVRIPWLGRTHLRSYAALPLLRESSVRGCRIGDLQPL